MAHLTIIHPLPLADLLLIFPELPFAFTELSPLEILVMLAPGVLRGHGIYVGSPACEGMHR